MTSPPWRARWPGRPSTPAPAWGGAVAGLPVAPAARGGMAARASAAAADLAWDVVAAPLVAFCRAPRGGPDLVAPAQLRVLLGVVGRGPVRRVWATVAEGGVGLLADGVRARLGRRSSADG